MPTSDPYTRQVTLTVAGKVIFMKQITNVFFLPSSSSCSSVILSVYGARRLSWNRWPLYAKDWMTDATFFCV